MKRNHSQTECSMLSAELEPMHLDGIKITWLGHATFRIETPRGKIILVDPWIMGNPMCPEKEKEIKNVDVMLCTHGHFDHIGDAVEIAKKQNPMVVGIYELCTWMEKKGAKQISPMNKGGRSEERRVGKECRYRAWPNGRKKTITYTKYKECA